jgi:hypothetical protein
MPLQGKRYVVFPGDSAGRPQIVERELAIHETGYEIKPEDVNGPLGTLPDRVKATAARIDAWLSRNELSVEPFLSVASRPTAYALRHRAEIIEPSHAVLGKALAKLDASDLARINVPLDLLIKILAKG